MTEALLAEYPDATIGRVETDSAGLYEAHIVTPADERLTVLVGEDFEVTSTEEQGDRPIRPRRVEDRRVLAAPSREGLGRRAHPGQPCEPGGSTATHGNCVQPRRIYSVSTYIRLVGRRSWRRR